MLLRSLNIQKWSHESSIIVPFPRRDPQFTPLRSAYVSSMFRWGSHRSRWKLRCQVELRQWDQLFDAFCVPKIHFRWFVCTATPPLPLDWMLSKLVSLQHVHFATTGAELFSAMVEFGDTHGAVLVRDMVEKASPTFSRHPGQWKKSMFPWWYQIQ